MNVPSITTLLLSIILQLPTYESKSQQAEGTITTPSCLQYTGGVSKEFLERMCPISELSKDYLKYLGHVDSFETKTNFLRMPNTPLKASDGDLKFSALENAVLLSKIKKKEALPDKYAQAQKLVEGLDSINDLNISKYEKLATMYQCIAKSGNYKRGDKGVNTLYSIINFPMLMAGEIGSCQHFTGMYLVLLGNYHYNISVKEGTTVIGGKRANHSWLQVKIDSTTIDLDPTWYNTFIPLTPRLKR